MTLTPEDLATERATHENVEDAWIVVATWIDSSNTHHGPFTHVDDAETWAREEFENEDACTQWELGVLTPSRPTWALAANAVAEHTRAAQNRILDAAGVHA